MVRGCDNLIGGLPSNVPDDAIFDYLDIQKEYKKLRECMEGYTLVIHCAALPYEGLSVFSPKLVAENIIAGTLSVASACIANDVDFLVNFSSMARYGNAPVPFEEKYSKRIPEDPYGLAKLQAEEHLELLYKLHGLQYCTVVPHNVIGVGQRYMDPYRNVIAIMINRTLQGKPIVIYGDGLQKRSFSDVRDCVKTVFNITQDNVPGHKVLREVFNIGPDESEMTILDAAKLVSKLCNVELNCKFYPNRPAEVKNAWCSSDKIKKSFGYKQTYNIEETVSSMINWIKQRGPEEFIYDNVELEFITKDTPTTWVERLI
jgi:UDP-glucose 4-epimerase